MAYNIMKIVAFVAIYILVMSLAFAIQFKMPDGLTKLSKTGKASVNGKDWMSTFSAILFDFRKKYSREPVLDKRKRKIYGSTILNFVLSRFCTTSHIASQFLTLAITIM